MKHTALAIKVLAATFLLIVVAGPARAATYTYKLLGFAYDEFVASPIQARDGLLYDAGQDQSTDFGLIFNVALGSTANVNSVYVFGDSTDGGLAIGGVIQGPDGTLYGTTGLAGANNLGVLYSATGLSPTQRGTETVLHNFTGGLDGATPQASLVADTAGNLYGTARDGGQNGAGVIFKYNIGTNTLTPLYQFGQQQFCRDGAGPYSGLVQGTDGDFYGATQNGGLDCTSGLGAIYKISASGTFTPVYWFCQTSGCPDGIVPNKYGPLVEYSDGNFYGMTDAYGTHNAGTIFKVTPGGTLTTLYNFDPSNGTDGGNPLGGLIVGSDGNFYGTTLNYGAGGYGTVFKFTPPATMTTLYSFDYANFDGNPYAGLVQGSDGNFYGVTSGFADGGGYVYEIAVSPALPAPVQLSFSPATVAAGSATTLNWKVLNAFSQTLRNCYASVQGSPAGAGSWTGLKAGSFSGTTKLLTGSASITPSAAGTYTYALTCGGQESGFATLAVTGGSGKATPGVALTATPNPAAIGQPITITATATGSGATPTGSITFKYGTLTLTTVPLASGSASFSPSTANLAAGNYVLTASYSGDGAYDPATSAGYSVTLTRRTPTVSLSATPNPAAVGQAITITPTVSGSGPAPMGTVAIKYGTLTLTTLSPGQSFSPSTATLPANTYNLTASYSGDANYLAADSQAYGITLTKAATSTGLTATPNPVTQGASCTMTATVQRSGDAGTPSGSVSFKYGAKTLATVSVNSAGVASFTASTSSIAVGYYAITATFNGDGNDNGSVSNTVSVYVKPPYDY